MRNVVGRNVNECYTIGLRMLDHDGTVEESRAGQVITMPSPVTTVYMRPQERVLFDPKRDANPFFHLMESLWMIAGRKDVEWISQFNSTIHQFSDDGESFHGAYGYRWRRHFNVDQLDATVALLKRDPGTRRAVIGMWDPNVDCGLEGKDFPCNMQIAFRIRKKELDMTVYNRSNDIIWGAYGANAVHMSFLHEWMAGMLGIRIGVYYQVSNDYHAYIGVFEKVGVPDPMPYDPYALGEVTATPFMENALRWNVELMRFMEEPLSVGFSEEFFAGVARPMVQSWYLFKKKNLRGALSHAETITATDWRKACHEWIVRKFEKTASRRGRPTLAYDADNIRPKRS